MFPKYRFVEPRSENTVLIEKISYVWAGFFGPAYLLVKAGPRKLIQSVLWSFGCAFGTLAFVVKGLNYVPGPMQIIVLIFLIPGVFILHSVKTVGLVRATYLQKKWLSRPPRES